MSDSRLIGFIASNPASRVVFMTRDFKLDEELQRHFSESTMKTLKVFPKMLVNFEELLCSYHKDNPAELVERSSLPLQNLNASGRLIATMFLTKTIYYSRAIIDNVNSSNLLVAFQSMRALVEVVAAVRHTLENLDPLIRECSSRGVITADEVGQLNLHCDLLLHGGRFDWAHYFESGAMAVLERKGKQRPKEQRQQFEARARYLKIEKCIESWSKKQPLARFAYDYLSLSKEVTSKGVRVVRVSQPSGTRRRSQRPFAGCGGPNRAALGGWPLSRFPLAPWGGRMARVFRWIAP
jgi:hypothetical protein